MALQAEVAPAFPSPDEIVQQAMQPLSPDVARIARAELASPYLVIFLVDSDLCSLMPGPGDVQ